MASDPLAAVAAEDELTRTVTELWVLVREQQYQLDACHAELERLRTEVRSMTGQVTDREGS